MTQEILASIWKYDEEQKMNRFKVKVNIYSNIEGKAKKSLVNKVKDSDEADNKDDGLESDSNNDNDIEEDIN